MKKNTLIAALTTVWLVALICTIGWMFWHEDWKYSLPTPVPQAYSPVMPGEEVHIFDKIDVEEAKPVFIHFFNPACPCSRFNIPAFTSLERKYGDQVHFAVVVMSADSAYDEQELRADFDLDASIPVSFDRTIADSCGVYSTPQAVLVDDQHRLYYRGNYNKSRYCTDRKTSYAQIALDSLLNNHMNLKPDAAALTSYGCQLPDCTR